MGEGKEAAGVSANRAYFLPSFLLSSESRSEMTTGEFTQAVY
jgi:hypothetical protein